MKMKVCKKCGAKKCREEFYRLTGKKYKDHWDCRDSYCKKCRSEYGTERMRIVKKQAVEYLGGTCVGCGLKTEHIEVYDFHHRDPTKKDFTIAKSRNSFENIKEELDKCDLYCANCHRILHYSI